MLALGIAVSATISLLVLVQVAGVAAYLYFSESYVTPEMDEAELSEAAIVLSLRGSDPFLNDCLQRLIMQDYPKYSLHIVIDHASDPARTVVEQWMAKAHTVPVHVEFLEDISDQAYLKTNAVRQCIQKLGPDVKFAVLADADTLVYDRWLRDMIVPMIGSDVGVVTGNRWYDPTRRASGTLVRCMYNVCSVAPMYFMRATWGGALAIHRDVFHQDYFYQHMRKTPSEDLAIQAAARFSRKQVAVQPHVMIINREECSLRGCFNFIRRQLIWTRLYHPNWSLIVLGVLAVYLILSAAFFGAIASAILRNRLALGLMGGSLLVQLIVAQFNLEWLHRSIAARMARVSGAPFPSINWAARIRLLCVWPLGFVVLCWAVFSASLSRRVQWRGITYEIVPPDGIHMLDYHPYVAEAAPDSTADGISLG